jgi:hypothetical protein
MIPQNIEVHIEELVLHGFAAKDRYAIGEAVQVELQRLFAEQGMPESPNAAYEVARLNGGAFTVKPGARAHTIGAQVAQAVYAGLGHRGEGGDGRSGEPYARPPGRTQASRKERKNG